MNQQENPMNTSSSPTLKIVILMVFAIVFAATLVALSVQEDPVEPRGVRFGDDTKRYSESFGVAGGATLLLDTDVGDILITGTEGDSVMVTVDVEGDRDDVEDFTVKFKQTDRGVEVRGRTRDHNGWHFEWGNFNARYVVSVPRNFNLRLETSGGDISVTDVHGSLRGSTSGGNVDITDISGETYMETSGGNITLKNVSGSVTTETSGGNIKGDGATGTLSVETSGGDIDIRGIRAKADASTSGGDVRLSFLDNQGVNASTSGGDIVIVFPEETGAEIYAETTGGSVRCDFAIRGTIDDGSLRGEINGGGLRVRAETSGGDISIRTVN
jgi:DUF4097 and DUF4098 domain-containing protein YvlB